MRVIIAEPCVLNTRGMTQISTLYMKKVEKTVKVLLEESRGMAVVQTKVPSSDSRRRMGIFWDIIFELQVY